jgi:hypothetical protein
MTMNWILLNIPLGVVMVAIAAGLPAWVMWKFPEGDDSTTAQVAYSNDIGVRDSGPRLWVVGTQTRGQRARTGVQAEMVCR